MSHADPVAVIGAGPNGLVAACVLARAGVPTVVFEANERPGGAVWSTEATLPGFVHDVGAGFFAFCDTPAFRALKLQDRGLRWAHCDIESAHPALDGSVACIARDLDLVASSFGSARDGETFTRLARWHASIEDRVLAQMSTIPQVGAALRLVPFAGLRLLWMFLASSGGLGRRLFDSEAARRVFPGMGMHVDLGPSDPMGAGIGYILSMVATTNGFRVPVGGAKAVTQALVADFEAHGGTVHYGARVERIVVEAGRPVGLRLAGGDEAGVRAVLADTSAPALFGALLGPPYVSGRILRRMKTFPHGVGTFKVDFALSGPVPWAVEACRRSAVVHAGESIDDLEHFTRVVRRGQLPDQPYLVIGQHTLCDPSRAPEGQHTLYCYTRGPAHLDATAHPGGWAAQRERYADVVAARIEGLAPGFGQTVLARRIQDPSDLQRMSANLVEGDFGGGSNQWNRQLVFRPVFPYFRHRTPVSGVYLCSMYAHPGTGVHGMCGYNAAQVALADLGGGAGGS